MSKKVRELLLVDREVYEFLKILFPEKTFSLTVGESTCLSSFSIIGNQAGYQDFSYEKYPEELQLWLLRLWMIGFIGRSFLEKNEIVKKVDNSYFLVKDIDSLLDKKSSAFVDCFSLLLKGGRTAYSEHLTKSLLWV